MFIFIAGGISGFIYFDYMALKFISGLIAIFGVISVVRRLRGFLR